MSVILNGAVKLYYYLNEDIADPRIQEWFLMRTPWPGLFIIGIYLMTVCKWLPEYISKRPAYDLRTVIITYNVVQIICCAYILYQSLVLGWLRHYKFMCHPIDDGEPTSVDYAWKVCYGYFILKLADLLDTVFFVLRKKQNQVTFLHVYHHFGMVMVSWGMVKWMPGGHATFLITLNSFVHILMYMYYLLTIWDESYKKSVWWKKHVTQIQLIQFTILLFHHLAVIVKKDCNYPKAGICILLTQNLFVIAMFTDFYIRAYVKIKKC